jgi:integrase
MPAQQRGGANRVGDKWRATWRDENGVRRAKSGFRTKGLALKYAGVQADRVEKIRSGQLAAEHERPATVNALIDAFLERHGRTVDPATARKLAQQLKHARDTFGTRKPDGLRRAELEDWRHDLPAGVRHDVFRAFRQALKWAHDRGLIEREPTLGIKNPKRKRAERRDVFPFESWEELEMIAEELDPRYAAIPIFATATGLRPEEWIALHRSDVDRKKKIVTVRRRYSGGMVKPGSKTGTERVVPLTQRALDWLAWAPPRVDTPILFPAPRGGYIDLERWRYREWVPALRAAGIEHRRIYDMRHTFATWAIAKGVPTLTLAQVMGTSVQQLEDTYVRWLKGTAESVRMMLEAADVS